MLKVKIISIGKWKEAWLVAAIGEYSKRLGPYLSIEWVHPKDDAHLLALCNKEKNLIALDPAGDSLTSESFAKFVLQSSRHTFVIGGPEGLPKGLQAAKTISLSPLTFTHQIARLILIEQLYRAIEINKGTSYNK